LYHGGIDIFHEPNLLLGRTDIDFGQGFYLTTLFDQAKRWAVRRSTWKTNKEAIVNIYNYNKDSDLKYKKFDGYSEEWLDFIVLNRTSKNRPVVVTYDIIEGNVADDDVINAVDRYVELLRNGKVTRNIKLGLLDELKFAKPNNQICLKTATAIKCLKFDKYEVVK
jgi:hypothetical protein